MYTQAVFQQTERLINYLKKHTQTVNVNLLQQQNIV